MDDHRSTGGEQTDGQRGPPGRKIMPQAEYRARLWRSRDWHLKEAFKAACEVVAHRNAAQRIEAELKDAET